MNQLLAFGVQFSGSGDAFLFYILAIGPLTVPFFVAAYRLWQSRNMQPFEKSLHKTTLRTCRIIVILYLTLIPLFIFAQISAWNRSEQQKTEIPDCSKGIASVKAKIYCGGK